MGLPTRVQRGQQEMDPINREFEGFFNRMFGRELDGGQFAPYGVDVREDADHIYVEAELPGFRKEDVDITLENQTLTISAERSTGNGNKQGQQQKPGAMLLHERRYSRFLRSFTLPPTVDEQHVDAKLQDGVLTITLNKREESKPRKVQVG
ncbi:Hsp20/alpha crystallin family protein [soil metagenome]